MTEPGPICGACLRPGPADWLALAERLVNEHYRSIQVGSDGEHADEAELAYGANLFITRLLKAVEAD